MIGALVGFILTTSLSKTSLNAWGWRLPFTIGSIVLGYIGWYIRTKIDDTPAFVQAEEKKPIGSVDILYAIRMHWLITELCCC